jgi:leucine dehydrogenase
MHPPAEPAEREPESVHRLEDEESGLVAYVVLDDTTLGPAIGGIRMKGYPDEVAARGDALHLARRMTWKCALAGLGGGGKAVVVADRVVDRRRACFVLGDFVESLAGKFLTAGDFGTTRRDLEWIATRTAYVADEERTGSLGDAVALGLIAAFEVLAPRIGRESLAELNVAVQGLGTIGMALVERLVAAGVVPFVCDVDPAAVKRAHRLGPVVAVEPSQISRLNVDVFAPCALGGGIDEALARATPARAIAGGANCQLATPRAGEILHERGIVYAPDFVVNAGAVIRGALAMRRERRGSDDEIAAIGPRLAAILDDAERLGITPEAAAIGAAQRQLAAGQVGRGATLAE